MLLCKVGLGEHRVVSNHHLLLMPSYVAQPMDKQEFLQLAAFTPYISYVILRVSKAAFVCMYLIIHGETKVHAMRVLLTCRGYYVGDTARVDSEAT